jgi:hypothetical protein
VSNVINKCAYCKEDFVKEQVVGRWITSGLRKFDLSNKSNEYFISAFHANCIDILREESLVFKPLTDADFEFGKIEQLSDNIKKHLDYYQKTKK